MISIHPIETIFYKDPHIFRNLIQENRLGIFYIHIITKNVFDVDSLSVGGQKMCKPGANAGGSSEISEALSYEIFHKWENAELVKVSKMWLCVYCNTCSLG